MQVVKEGFPLLMLAVFVSLSEVRKLSPLDLHCRHSVSPHVHLSIAIVS